MQNFPSGQGSSSQPQNDQNTGQNSGYSQPRRNYSAYNLLFLYLEGLGINPDKHDLTELDQKTLALKLNALTIRAIVIGNDVDTTLGDLEDANVQIENMRDKLQNDDKYPTIRLEVYQQSRTGNFYKYLDNLGINPEKHQISLLKKEDLYFKLNGMIIKALLMAKDLDRAKQDLEEAKDQIKKLRDELNANK